MFVLMSKAPWLENYATFSEKFFIGITMMLLGLSIVILILALLSMLVNLMSRLISGGKKDTPEKAIQTEMPSVAAPEEPPQTAVNHELVAVLAAAVAAYQADLKPKSTAGFTFRRTRRV